MATSAVSASHQRAARVAGFAYLFGFANVVFANFRIQEPLIVADDAAQTARNLLAHQQLFRVGIACDLVYCLASIVALVAIYVIQEPFRRGLASLAALWKLVYVGAWVLMTLNLLDALRILQRSPYLEVFEPDRVQALARSAIGGGFDTYYVGLVFYGVGAALAFYVFFRSGQIPRVLGLGGVITCAFCTACSFAFLVYPDFSKTVGLWWFDTPMGLVETATSFWLLFRGLRQPVPS